jgi:LytS/YehU family sensor histidine kinase
MTLQPLVENALRHGIGARIEGGTIRVSAERRNGVLLLGVEDDGPGFAARRYERTGLGNLRRRLDTLYGAAAELRLERGEGGARVVVRLPLASGGPPAA